MTISEKLAKKMLIDAGYRVERAVKTAWNRNDLFNLWDFIAVNKKEIRFIQVSTIYLTEGSHAGKDYSGFPCPTNCTKEFWRWDKKKKEFIIKIL